MLNQEQRNNEILKYGVNTLSTKYNDLKQTNQRQAQSIVDNNYQMNMLRERAASAEHKIEALDKAHIQIR